MALAQPASPRASLIVCWPLVLQTGGFGFENLTRGFNGTFRELPPAADPQLPYFDLMWVGEILEAVS